MYAARRARRRWLNERSDEARDESVRLEKDKKRAIEEAKRAGYRRFLSEAAQGDKLWDLSRWTKGSGGQAQVPALATAGGEAREHTEQAEALKARFYPKPPSGANQQDPAAPESRFEVSDEISREEIAGILAGCSSKSAAGDDGVPFSVLKKLGDPVIDCLARITNASWRLRCFPRFFRRARTIVLKKPGKESYETARAWRPIALLKTIGKVIEKATAKRIRQAAEDRGLLPEEQMGARAGRSTASALELLTGLVKTVWGSHKGHAATLLSLDISGAFDTVIHDKLCKIITSNGYPDWVIEWVRSFLADRSTTLLFNGVETEEFKVEAGVPQGSPLSPILFLLYNADLVRICSRAREGVHGIGFVDDLNVLAYGPSTEHNCAKLSRVHELCLAWAREHGIVFAPDKYELIHFTTATRRQNLGACITLGEIEKAPAKSVRVLGVWLDPKLRWSEHAKIVESKGQQCLGGFRRIVTSTWGAGFARARLLYNAVVKPALTYGGEIWSERAPGKESKALARAAIAQNKCLRAVCGGFRATPVRELETETFTPPMDLAIREQKAAHLRRTYSAPVGEFIKAQCLVVCKRAERRRRGAPRAPLRNAPVIQERIAWAEERRSRLGGGRPAVLREWRERWKSSTKGRVSVAAQEPPSKKRLELHKDLAKAESSVLVQARTEVIGLRDYLFHRKVPTIDSPYCETCEQYRETPSHLLTACSHENERRTWRRDTTFRAMVTDPLLVKRTTSWMIRSGRISQFKLAGRLLYGDGAEE